MPSIMMDAVTDAYSQLPIRVKTEKKFTGPKIGAIFCKITSQITTQNRSCRTRTSGRSFGPLKSDLGVFWPVRGTDFIMGKNKNAIFSKSPHGPI